MKFNPLYALAGFLGGAWIYSQRTVGVKTQAELDALAAELGLKPSPEQDIVEDYVGSGEPGQPLPLIILLHAEGSTAEQAMAVLAPLEQPARVLAPLGRYQLDGKRYFINPNLVGDAYREALKAELDRLVGVVEGIVDAAGAVPTRAVVVGLGAAGGLAIGIGLRAPLSVRQAWGTGGAVPLAWIPLTYTKLLNLQRPQLRKLSFGEGVAVDDASSQLARDRGFDFSTMTVNGPPSIELVQKWMLGDLAELLNT